MDQKEFLSTIQAFINKEGFPTNDELNAIGDDYELYVDWYSAFPDLNCRSHFILGMIFMYKKWKKIKE